MINITLTKDQAQVVSESTQPIEVRDDQGRVVAHLTPLDPSDIEAVEYFKQTRGSVKATISSAQVASHLERLEEIRQREGLDESKMLDLLRQWQAEEA